MNGDPLALWAIDEGNEPISPAKAMWNRSKQRLFGASTSALADVGDKRGGLFSRTRVNLAKEKKQMRRSMVNLFTRSQTDLITSNLTRRIPESPSLPSFFSPSSPRPRTGIAREEYTRSKPISSPCAPLPSAMNLSSRLLAARLHPGTQTLSGLPDNHRPLRFAKWTNDKLAPPRPPSKRQGRSDAGPSISRVPRPQLELKRTTIFVAPDIATEQYREGDNSVVGLDTLQAWAETRAKQRLQIAIELVPSEAIYPPSPQDRFLSEFHPYIQSSIHAVTHEDVQQTKFWAKAAFQVVLLRRDFRSDYVTTEEAIHEALATPLPSRPGIEQTRRRSSWIGGLSTDAWVKRLSRLTEAGEDGPSAHRQSFFERVLPSRTSSLGSISLSTQRNWS